MNSDFDSARHSIEGCWIVFRLTVQKILTILTLSDLDIARKLWKFAVNRLPQAAGQIRHDLGDEFISDERAVFQCTNQRGSDKREQHLHFSRRFLFAQYLQVKQRLIQSVVSMSVCHTAIARDICSQMNETSA
jgi:hypothetical protein